MFNCYTRAFKKLIRIIKQEGTANGKRLTLNYYKHLLREERACMLAQAVYDGVQMEVIK